ncbi:hypothetical protein J0X12_07725 [Sneathiella sp. CAU 1612]|uniref:DUF4156 domain-containing protein n=1 Tax=Sneathiella sedimenti TaxID=2816034 RepID=A0ABS3F571_9PROT|nr:hypothetical protein [Sneathiella sedimenti]MBO0333497.1 hypothetical protein [Sneathiella sedimenti]
MRRVSVLLCSLFLTACATSGEPQDTHGVIITTNVEIAKCEPIGKFFGHSSAYGVFAGSGFAAAKESAMKQAAANGATHITWEEETVRYGSTSVTGIAGKCS